MNQTQIDAAARFLLERRKDPQVSGRLAPDLRPSTNEEAVAIQKILMTGMGDKVGGWKCLLPTSEKTNIGAIFAKTIHDKSPCPIKLDKGVCRIEPEIAFRFKNDLPPRETDYSDAEIMAALDGAYMALEMIQKRYSGTEEVSYFENLADCLYNQGMYLGPKIALDKAISAAQIDIVLTQGASKSFTGKHQNNSPLKPVLWLVNFLRKQGMGIKAGQAVITGSYAGVHEVRPSEEFTIEYTGLGKMSVLFEP